MAQSLSPFSQGSGATPLTKRLMMALMGGAGLILLGGGGALVGLNSHLAGLQAAVHQKQHEVDGSEGIAKQYLSTQEAYTQTQSRMQCLEASVTPKSYVPTLLGQLQALAATTHLNVLAVRPAAPAPPAPPAAARPAAGGDTPAAGADVKKAPPPPPYDTLGIDVDVTGTYADTATFLYSLTRFPKIISVIAVQMHPAGLTDKTNPNAAPLVSTNLRLVAYMFHDAALDTALPAMPGASMAQTVPTGSIRPAVFSTSVVPPAAVGTISGAFGHAASGAVGATKAANARGDVGVGTL